MMIRFYCVVKGWRAAVTPILHPSLWLGARVTTAASAAGLRLVRRRAGLSEQRLHGIASRRSFGLDLRDGRGGAIGEVRRFADRLDVQLHGADHALGERELVHLRDERELRVQLRRQLDAER